jgi:ABC-2 type transport system permease protein
MALVGRLLKTLPRESRAILVKDLRIFPRDLRNVQQLIFPLAMAGFWIFRLATGGGLSSTGRTTGFDRLISSIGTAAISFFICMVFSSALVGSGLNREGKAFWILRLAPISARRMLLGKLVLAYLPFPVVGTVFVGLFSIIQHSTLLIFIRSLALVLIAGLGTSSIGLGIGAAFPRLDWENPQRQSSTRAALLVIILYPIYLVVALIAAFGPSLFARFVPRLALALTVLGWGLLVGLTAVVVWGALTFGAARLERFEAV